jgi:small subunit ribosomal protein S13
LARIEGVNLPDNKKVLIGLTYIYGIGHSRSTRILEQSGIDPEKKIKDLSAEEIARIRALLQEEGMIEGDLRKDTSMNIKRLMDISCYRGIRHRKGLPVHGQRTHTNARTRKGPRRKKK